MISPEKRPTRLGREVAIKSVGPRFQAKEMAANLRLEARAVLVLNHANITALYNICPDNDSEFLVMEPTRSRLLKVE